MSLRTWKKAFYPLTAREQVESNDMPIALVEHSLRKWRGLTSENMAAHRLKRGSGKGIQDKGGNEMLINDESCALCLVYSFDDSLDCGQCPLYSVLGMRCDSTLTGPYQRFLSGDPLPMIRWLEATHALLVAREMAIP